MVDPIIQTSEYTPKSIIQLSMDLTTWFQSDYSHHPLWQLSTTFLQPHFKLKWLFDTRGVL